MRRTLTIMLLVLTPISGGTAHGDTITDFVDDARFSLNARMRYEFVDQSGFADNTDALTLRTRIGVESGAAFNLQFLIEAENVLDLSGDRYNSTINGRTNLPVVADPEATEINRAQLVFTGVRETTITMGRQRIILDNARFIGNVGWRQNEQTFDAVRVASQLIGPLAVDYAYIDRVHRIFGGDSPVGEFDSDSHVIRVGAPTPIGELSATALLLDLEQAPAASTATIAARLTGTVDINADVSLDYVAGYAHQVDRANNPLDISLDYYHAQGALNGGGFTAGAGIEVLEGDGTSGFSTPLATLHAFQGDADVFLSTPVAGLRDLYAFAGWRSDDVAVGEGLAARLRWHDFASDDAGVSFGSELDAALVWTLNEHVALQFNAAVFDGDAGGPADRTKLFAQVTVTY